MRCERNVNCHLFLPARSVHCARRLFRADRYKTDYDTAGGNRECLDAVNHTVRGSPAKAQVLDFLRPLALVYMCVRRLSIHSSIDRKNFILSRSPYIQIVRYMAGEYHRTAAHVRSLDVLTCHPPPSRIPHLPHVRPPRRLPTLIARANGPRFNLLFLPNNSSKRTNIAGTLSTFIPSVILSIGASCQSGRRYMVYTLHTHFGRFSELGVYMEMHLIRRKDHIYSQAILNTGSRGFRGSFRYDTCAARAESCSRAVFGLSYTYTFLRKN